MLSPLDETLRHQLTTTFDHAGTSDPRFFDRYWFAVYDPDGSEPAINLGMCSYLNMNVVDGYVTMIQDGHQHNLRLSRVLRPELFQANPNVNVLGPLEVEVVEPFRHLSLRLTDNDAGISFDLEWRSVLPPYEEDRNFTRVRGRLSQDYLRYNQAGTVDGWVVLDGKRTEVNQWWGGRDHSWGIRTDVAGGDPVTGKSVDRGDAGGLLWTWLTFGAEDMGGHIQLQEIADGTPIHQEALLRWADGSQVATGRVHLDFDLLPGTRRFSRAVWHLDVRGGAAPGSWRVDMVPISQSLAMVGMGYSMGYTDRRGFGVYRGDDHSEHDVYDISHGEDIVLPDGSVDRPYHRDCAVQVAVVAPDGREFRGAGHSAILPLGSLDHRGIA
jgi:hypothetical protein